MLRICEEANVPYVVDPTNNNVAFARNAIRRHLETLREEQIEPVAMSYPRMAPFLQFMDRYRAMMSGEVTRLTSSILTIDPDIGTAFIAITPKKDNNWFANQHIAVRLLSRLIAWASPTKKPIRSHKIVDLYRKMANYVYHQADFRPSTTANCIIVPPSFRKSGVWAIAREPLSQSRRHFVDLPVNQPFIWDRRYQITLQPTSSTIHNEAELASLLFKTYMQQTKGIIEPSVSDASLVSSRFSISQISQADIHYLQRARRPIMTQKHHVALKHFLQTMPVISRFTIPGIYWDGMTSTGHTIHQLIAIPSLGINLKENTIQISCHYLNALTVHDDIADVP